MQKEIKTCPVCEKEHTNKKYCSVKCATSVNNRTVVRKLKRGRKEYAKWRYKKKLCPACHVEHHHRGEYCSQKCAQLITQRKPERIAKTSENTKEWFKTPEGIAHSIINNKNINNKTKIIPEDYAIEIPTIYDFEIQEDDIKW